MSYLHAITATLRQAGIDPGKGALNRSALRPGWDYWVPQPPPGQTPASFDPSQAVTWATTKPDTDGGGMARTPQSQIVTAGAVPPRTLPVFDITMDVHHLLAGIWRQTLVRPSDDGSPIGDNPYLVTNTAAICSSSRHLMALVGHPPRDLAMWFDSLRARDAPLFGLVLAKEFKAALAHDPAIIASPWPDTVRSLWLNDEGDRLPPFLVAVLYAELARTAMNQAGLLALSFDGGLELTTKLLLERVGTHFGLGRTPAAGRAIEHAPFQTLALGPPDALIEQGDVASIEAWASTAAAGVALTAGLRGVIDITPETVAQAEALREGFAAHPQNQREARQGQGLSHQPRRAAAFWGLSWRLNAAVRLLEIADTARMWNRFYRPQGPLLPNAMNYRSASPVAIALAAIRFRWTAEHDLAAGLKTLGEVMAKEDKRILNFENWKPDQIDPLTIDGYLGRMSGLELLKQARNEMLRLPRPGEMGYTARSQAHLWLDNVGDDLPRYRHHQHVAVQGHNTALAGKLPIGFGRMSGVPDEVVALQARPNGIADRKLKDDAMQPPGRAMTLDPSAATGAQLEGQRISAFSTDPMWTRLLRKKSR